jgi:hypothetical protein
MIGLAIYFGVVIIMLGGSVRRPAFALGAFLCMFGLEQWGAAKIGFIASNGSFTNYLAVVIVMIAFCVRLFRPGGWRFINGPIHVLVILIYLYAALTLMWTPSYSLAMEEWRAQAPYLLFSVVFLPLLVQNAGDAMEGLRGTIIPGAILAAALAFLVQWGYRRIESDVSAGEAIQLPLAIAQLGAVVFVLAVLYFKWRGVSALIALALVAISMILVVKTGSRGQLISMILSAMLFFPMSRGWSFSRGAIIGLVGAGLALVAIWTLLPDLSNLLSAEQGRFDSERAVVDYEERMAAAQRLFDVYLSSGVLGLLFGLGNSASFSPQILGFYTHIVPVEILCELGAVGLMLFLTILGLAARAMLRFSSSLASLQVSAEMRRSIACLGALAFIELMLSFKEGSLVRDVNLFLFPILIEGVLASAAARIAAKAPSASFEPPAMEGGRRPHLSVRS